MNISRRSFFGLVAGAAVVSATRDAWPAEQVIPEIWGDGVHDDGPGLRAIYLKKPVRIMKDGFRYHIQPDGSPFIYFPPGTYCVDRTDAGDEELRGMKPAGIWQGAGEGKTIILRRSRYNVLEAVA